MIVSRPATRADVSLFYPEATASFRAMVCELDGKVEGIIGIALSRPIASLFSVFTEALRPYLKSLTVLRCIEWAKRAVRASRLRVRAIAEPTETTAPTILKRLGFEYVETVDGDSIWEYVG